MSPDRARIVAARQLLVHVPDLVLSGSKPVREIEKDPDIHDRISERLRTLEDATRYLPNQIFIGAEEPRPLNATGRPWWSAPLEPRTTGRWGRIIGQGAFLSAVAAVDSAGLVEFGDEATRPDREGEDLAEALSVGQASFGAIPGGAEIPGRSGPIGSVRAGYTGDESLSPAVILENLSTKASAALALADCLRESSLDPGRLDLVISCSEEAVGDRYQRGGGNLGKAVAEAVGAVNASGFDVKNFCAAPVPALVVASSLISSGVVSTVAVVAGGSVPKLGMKFQGHLGSGMPVLEDCLGGFAAVLSGEGEGPRLRYEAVGRHTVAAGGSNQAIFHQLVIEPLERVGLKADDVGLFGTELHNPELTEPQGSGDVPLRNYRMIAALAARAHHISEDGVQQFLAERCVAGFAPTQGHLASAICLLPAALRRLETGMNRVQLVAKGSLFLGKMSTLSDGMSVLIEA